MAANEEFLNVSSFKVTLDGTTWTTYESVSGAGLDIERVPFQSDNNVIKNRPGRINARDIHLTRRFKKDKEIYNWVKEIKAGKQSRKSGSIILMDDEQKEIARFNFFNAWPMSWSGPALSKDHGGNSVLKEELVLSVEDVELA